jgi:hypothetical protein
MMETPEREARVAAAELTRGVHPAFAGAAQKTA